MLLIAWVGLPLKDIIGIVLRRCCVVVDEAFKLSSLTSFNVLRNDETLNRWFDTELYDISYLKLSASLSYVVKLGIEKVTLIVRYTSFVQVSFDVLSFLHRAHRRWRNKKFSYIFSSVHLSIVSKNTTNYLDLFKMKA